MRSIFLYILIWVLPLAAFSQSVEIHNLSTNTFNFKIDFAETLQDRIIFSYYDFEKKRPVLYSSDFDGSNLQEIASENDMRSFHKVGELIYFFALNDDATKHSLWCTNGTKAGTFFLAEVSSYITSYRPSPLSATEKLFIFTAVSAEKTKQLWRTDGTKNGTYVIKDFSDKSAFGSSISNGKSMFFNVIPDINKGGQELWKTDGTKSNTIKIKDFIRIHPFKNTQGIKSASIIDSTLIFSAFTENEGYELWKSNGTAAGTMLIKDLNPEIDSISQKPKSANPMIFATIGNKAYFYLTNANYLYNIGSTDGAPEGTEILKTIPRANWHNYINIYHAFMIGDKIGLNAISDSTGWEYFVTDTLKNDVFNSLDIWKGFGSGWQNGSLTGNANGKRFYFVGNDGKNGNELWRTDGTKEGTFMIVEHLPGMRSKPLNILYQKNDTLIYTTTYENNLKLYSITNAGNLPEKQTTEPGKPVDWFTMFGGDFSVGSSYYCTNEALKIDDDGNVLVLGSSQSYIVRYYDTALKTFGPNISQNYWAHNFITKYTKDGKLLWAKPIGGETFAKNADLLTDEENNIYVAGPFNQRAIIDDEFVESGQSAVYLTKLNKDGKKIWHTTAWAPSWMETEKIHLSENKIFMGGSYRQFFSFWQNIQLQADTSPVCYLTSFDTSGNLLWGRNLHSEWNHAAKITDIKSAKNGKIYVLASMGTRNTSAPCRFTNFYFKVFCINQKTGETIWEKLFESTDLMVAGTLEISTLGEIMVAGNFRGELYADDHVLKTDKGENCNLQTSFFIKLNNYGKVISAKTANPVENDIYQVLAMQDGTFYETGIKTVRNSEGYRGYDYPLPKGERRVYVQHKSATGKILAERDFFRFGNNFEPRIAVDKDRNIFLSDVFAFGLDTIAKSYVETGHNTNIFLMKFKLGKEFYKPETENSEENGLITIGPNPTQNYLYINSTKNTFINYNISLYSMLGQQILHTRKTDDLQTFRLDMNQLSPGVYILLLENSSETVSRKVIKY